MHAASVLWTMVVKGAQDHHDRQGQVLGHNPPLHASARCLSCFILGTSASEVRSEILVLVLASIQDRLCAKHSVWSGFVGVVEGMTYQARRERKILKDVQQVPCTKASLTFRCGSHQVVRPAVQPTECPYRLHFLGPWLSSFPDLRLCGLR